MSTLLIQCLQNILDLMGLMSIQSIRLNYNVNPNTKYSNYIEHRIKCSNYKGFDLYLQITTNFKLTLRIKATLN